MSSYIYLYKVTQILFSNDWLLLPHKEFISPIERRKTIAE